MKNPARVRDGQMVFFEDPAVDRLLGTILALAGEIYVQRDRIRVLERLLTENGTLPAGAAESYVIPDEAAAEWRTERDAFFDRVLTPLAADWFGPEATLKAAAAQARAART
ncbi:hypothetical protein [Streptomyces sp. NPDC058953]|uniref:hypothetical protein n=1 Tax=unclassified Streptomyces TaxID=2593676 RepID=UPI0036A8DC7F